MAENAQDVFDELYDAINGDDYIEELEGSVLDSIYNRVTSSFKA